MGYVCGVMGRCQYYNFSSASYRNARLHQRTLRSLDANYKSDYKNNGLWRSTGRIRLSAQQTGYTHAYFSQSRRLLERYVEH